MPTNIRAMTSQEPGDYKDGVIASSQMRFEDTTARTLKVRVSGDAPLFPRLGPHQTEIIGEDHNLVICTTFPRRLQGALVVLYPAEFALRCEFTTYRYILEEKAILE